VSDAGAGSGDDGDFAGKRGESGRGFSGHACSSWV
jgi:hypothetical protein